MRSVLRICALVAALAMSVLLAAGPATQVEVIVRLIPSDLRPPVINGLDANGHSVPNGGADAANRPILHGTAEPDVAIHILVDGIDAGMVQSDTLGRWSLTVPMASGIHSIVAADQTFNQSSQPWQYTVTDVIPVAGSNPTQMNCGFGGLFAALGLVLVMMAPRLASRRAPRRD